ncbi:hypothetical protein HOD29_02145 [archaeon]|jgi:hypothetical protein|nr:hypothetical protein [archaeon]
MEKEEFENNLRKVYEISDGHNNNNNKKIISYFEAIEKNSEKRKLY